MLAQEGHYPVRLEILDAEAHVKPGRLRARTLDEHEVLRTRADPEDGERGTPVSLGAGTPLRLLVGHDLHVRESQVPLEGRLHVRHVVLDMVHREDLDGRRIAGPADGRGGGVAHLAEEAHAPARDHRIELERGTVRAVEVDPIDRGSLAEDRARGGPHLGERPENPVNVEILDPPAEVGPAAWQLWPYHREALRERHVGRRIDPGTEHRLAEATPAIVLEGVTRDPQHALVPRNRLRQVLASEAHVVQGEHRDREKVLEHPAHGPGEAFEGSRPPHRRREEGEEEFPARHPTSSRG